MGTVIRYIFLLFVLAGALTACSGPRYVDSGFGVTTYGFIGIDAAGRGFTFDQRTNLREYAEGSYVFVSRDSIALDARFDSLAISYQLFHNAATLNHANAYLPYRSAIQGERIVRARRPPLEMPGPSRPASAASASSSCVEAPSA